MFYKRFSPVPPDRSVVAYDIETCPLPETHLSAIHRGRVDKEVRLQLERRPDMPEAEARCLAQSVHSLSGRVCCISAVAGTLAKGPRDPISFTAAAPEDEAPMLERFWETVAKFNCKPVWVTFNGKAFDVPFLLARSAHHGIAPTRRDLINTYPYASDQHADLYLAFGRTRYTLEDLCMLLGVQTPKNGFDGSQVAGAVEAGRIAEVAAYCERDVVATWRCYERMHAHLN